MKRINEGYDEERDRRLLTDLAFIKRKLRYPISRRTMPAAFVITCALYLIIRAVWSMVFLQHTHTAPLYVVILIPCLTVLAVASGVYGYIQTLRFRVIPTPFSQQENITLVHNFLQSQQLLIYQVAEAPEVCQIASRPLGNAKDDRREVMVFIADDNRILLNSHFTGQRFTVTRPSRNYNVMARQLHSWIQTNYGKGISIIR